MQSTNVNGLLELVDDIDVFVFDAFGVLNVGERPIEGAVETVTALRGLGKRLFVVTNAASMSLRQARQKFDRLGFDFADEEIITSRMAAEAAVSQHSARTWGVIAGDEFFEGDLDFPCLKLSTSQRDYDQVDGFLFLSAKRWNAQQALILEHSLSNRVRPLIIANPDVIAPREIGFSTEPGYSGHRIADLLDIQVEFYGKPFPSVFDIVTQRLQGDVLPQRICMVGDTLHTDVLGGAFQGWSTALITDYGLFRGHDAEKFILQSGIRPDFIAPCI
ncbi:MAG: HAD hydrolase-like protein [Rhizobiaceae bacterium]